MKYSLTYKDGKAWASSSMINEINNAVIKNMKVYAMLFLKDSHNGEICFECTNEDRDVESTESCYELGDISADWETIRTDLENRKIPEDWNTKYEKEKTEEDNKMEENKNITMQEQETPKETANNIVTSDEATTEKIENNVAASDKTMTGSTENSLPPISKDSPYAVLVQRDGFQLNMQICGDMTTMQSDGCKLYLTNIETGKLYISASSEITISRARLLSANDHSVMNVVSTFLVNFSDDDKKKAFERAKQYLEVVENITKASSSRNIEDVFNDIVNFAKSKAMSECTDDESSHNYKYNEREGTIAIISNQFQKLLDEADAGCTKTVFCKKLRMLEQHYGKTIIISNRGGTGYGFNDTNNRRYYKFVANPFDTDTKEV